MRTAQIGPDLRLINNFKWNITRLRIPTGGVVFFDNFTSVAEVLNLGLPRTSGQDRT